MMMTVMMILMDGVIGNIKRCNIYHKVKIVLSMFNSFPKYERSRLIQKTIKIQIK